MHPLACRNFTIIAWSCFVLAMFLPLVLLLNADALIITVYTVVMIAVLTAMMANIVYALILHLQQKKRFREDPIHEHWAKGAWAKASQRNGR